MLSLLECHQFNKLILSIPGTFSIYLRTVSIMVGRTESSCGDKAKMQMIQPSNSREVQTMGNRKSERVGNPPGGRAM